MRILLIGHKGFIGSNLVKYLTYKEHEVINSRHRVDDKEVVFGKYDEFQLVISLT